MTHAEQLSGRRGAACYRRPIGERPTVLATAPEPSQGAMTDVDPARVRLRCLPPTAAFGAIHLAEELETIGVAFLMTERKAS